jgi:hypothetical protein
MSTRLVCLANSWKLRGRCVAGIELRTGRWVRPVTNLPHGEVPVRQTCVGGREPKLLDVLDIPLDTTGPDYGFERENRTILLGDWVLAGTLDGKEVGRYVETGRPVLHNSYKYVGRGTLERMPADQRQTLQLIKVNRLVIYEAQRSSGKRKWEGLVPMQDGSGKRLGITDPAFCAKLDRGHRPREACLLTMSLSLPYTPPNWDGPADPCWKLIAGVIELQV